jgi:hypothetical protein
MALLVLILAPHTRKCTNSDAKFFFFDALIV